MRKVELGDVVSIHCVGKLKSGEVFEDTTQGEPFVFEVGSPEVIEGLSEAVLGMSEGEEKEVVIPAEKAFGPRDENLIKRIPKEAINFDVEPHPGLLLNLIVETPQGEMNIPGKVVDVNEEEVVLDLNPPLAGEDLVFYIKVVKIMDKESPLIIS